jgi:hypothetical protein
VAASATCMTIGAVKFPGRGQNGILHFMRGDNGPHDILNPGEVVMHCILVSGGYVFMTLPADSASVLLGGVFYHTFVGIVLVGDIFAFVTIDTSYLAMHRVDVVLINTIGVPAPHPRSRNTSTGYGRCPSRGSSAVAVHLVQIRVAFYAFAA